MHNKVIRIVILVITGFVALTAIGSGVALLAGQDVARLPLAVLGGTSLRVGGVAALLLILAVGGSGMAAFVAVWRRKPSAIWLAVVSGVMVMTYVLVELLLVEQLPMTPTFTEFFFFSLGYAVVVSGILAAIAECYRVRGDSAMRSADANNLWTHSIAPPRPFFRD